MAALSRSSTTSRGDVAPVLDRGAALWPGPSPGGAGRRTGTATRTRGRVDPPGGEPPRRYRDLFVIVRGCSGARRRWAVGCTVPGRATARREVTDAERPTGRAPAALRSSDRHPNPSSGLPTRASTGTIRPVRRHRSSRGRRAESSSGVDGRSEGWGLVVGGGRRRAAVVGAGSPVPSEGPPRSIQPPRGAHRRNRIRGGARARGTFGRLDRAKGPFAQNQPRRK